MMVSHIVVAGITGHYDGDFQKAGGHAAGWVGVVFIWVSRAQRLGVSFTNHLSDRSSAPISHILGDRLLGSLPPRSSLLATEVKQSA